MICLVSLNLFFGRSPPLAEIYIPRGLSDFLTHIVFLGTTTAWGLRLHGTLDDCAWSPTRRINVKNSCNKGLYSARC